MNESKIAVRYSRALFMSAKEKGLISEVRADMKYLLELSELQDFRDVIDSPVIENSRKKAVMTALLKDKFNDIAFGLVLLTVKNNRESYLPGMARCFIDEADRAEGITKVSLTTAVEISEENRKELLGRIEKDLSTKVEMDEKRDSGIGGGFILKIEDLYIDASVRSKLRKIEAELLKEL